VEMRAFGAPEPETDVMMLSAIAAAGGALPSDVVAAVVVGPDPPRRGSGYRAMLESVLLPTVSQIAVYLDVVVGGALAAEDAVGVLEVGRRRGMRPRVHVGGEDALEVAFQARAVSVDGMWGMEQSADAVADAGMVMVSLPAVSWISDRPEPARIMWEKGVVVGLGTGCSGGMVPTIPMAMAAAVHHGGLTPDQALWSATRGGALAVEEPERGSVAPGTVADLVVLEAEATYDIVSEPGRDPVVRVVKDGSPL
jgi:imidazolonepropionase